MAILELILKAAGFRRESVEVIKSLDGVRGAAKLTRDEMGRFTNKTDDMGSATRRLKTDLVGLGTAFAGFLTIRSVIDSVAKYEQTLATLKGVTQATTEEMKLFDTASKQMAATSRFSAEQVASSILTLARAGLTAQQSVEALSGVLNLASTEMITTEESADLVISAMSQFSLAAAESAKITDVLTASANAANTSAAELGQALKFSGLFAATAGVDFETTSAALALLSNSALRGMLGGTALRGVIANLLQPTNEAQAAFKTLGLTAEDVDIKTIGLVETLKRLREAGVGNDANLALAIFGREIAPGALALVNGGDQLQRFIDLNKSAAGESQKLREAMDSTISGAFARFKNSLELVSISIGEGGLIGSIRSLLDLSTGVLRVFTGQATAADQASWSIWALKEALETLITAAGVFVGLRITVFIVELVVAIRAAKTATDLFTAAIARNPLGILAVALAFVITRFIDFDTKVQSATVEMSAFDLQVKQTTQTMEGFRLAQERAARTGDNQRRIAALRQEEQALQDIADKLEGTADFVPFKQVEASLGKASPALENLKKMIEAQAKELGKRLEGSIKIDPAKMIQVGATDATSGSIPSLLSGGSNDPMKGLFNLAAFGNLPYKEQISGMDVAAKEYQKALENRIKEIQAIIEKAQADSAPKPDTQGADIFRTQMEALQEESRLLPLNTQQREVANRVRKAEQDFIEKGVVGYQKYLAVISRVSAENIRAASAKKFDTDFQQLLDGLKQEQDLIGKTADERERIISLRKLERDAVEAGVAGVGKYVAALDRELSTLQRRKALQEQIETEKKRLTEERQEAEKARIRDQTEADASIAKSFKDLENEIALVEKFFGQTERLNDERERAAAIADVQAQAEKAYGKGTSEVQSQVEFFATSLERLNRARQRSGAQAAITDMDKSLQAEIDALGKLGIEREKAAEIARYQIEVDKLYAKGSDENIAAMDRMRSKLQELEEAQRLRDVADGLANAWGDFFSSITFGSQSAMDSLKQLIVQMERAVLQSLLFKPFTDALSAGIGSFLGLTPNANGNVFNQGSVTAFANGAVVSGPTYFPMSGGRTGLMGEKGAEAIMPLSRGSDGKLGVAMNGKASGGTTIVQVNLKNRPDEPFRRTMRIAGDEARRVLRR